MLGLCLVVEAISGISVAKKKKEEILDQVLQQLTLFPDPQLRGQLCSLCYHSPPNGRNLTFAITSLNVWVTVRSS